MQPCHRGRSRSARARVVCEDKLPSTQHPARLRERLSWLHVELLLHELRADPATPTALLCFEYPAALWALEASCQTQP
eukprot:6482317-Amphidinium_carterae.1